MTRKSRGVQANGAEIRQRRRTLVLTQEQLALDAQCDVKTVRNAERGQMLDLSTLQRIAFALNCTLESLSASVLQPDAATHGHFTLIQRWIERIHERDVEGIVRCYHAEGELLHPDGEPSLPSGSFRGSDAISRFARSLFTTTACFSIARTKPISATGNTVLLRAEQTFRPRFGGQEMHVQAVHEFTIDDAHFHRHLIMLGPVSRKNNPPVSSR